MKSDKEIWEKSLDKKDNVKSFDVKPGGAKLPARKIFRTERDKLLESQKKMGSENKDKSIKELNKRIKKLEKDVSKLTKMFNHLRNKESDAYEDKTTKK